MRLATVGFDNVQGFVVRQAIDRLGCAWVRVSADSELWASAATLAEELRSCDVVLTSTHAGPQVATLARALAAIDAAVIPVPPFHDDIVGWARVGSFDATRDDLLTRAAGMLTRCGHPASPTLPSILRASMGGAHELDGSVGGLRTVAIAQQAFHELTVSNVEIALRCVAAEVDGGLYPPERPTAQPTHGLWSPERGIHAHASAPAGELCIVSLPRHHVCGDNTRYLETLFADLQRVGLSPLGWFGSAAELTGDLADLLPQARIWINTRGFTLTGAHGDPEQQRGEEILRRLGVPALSAIVSTAQTSEQWRDSREGVSSVTLAMQVSVPEMQGLTAPVLLGCRDAETDAIVAIPENARALAQLAARWVQLADTPVAQRRISVVLIAHDPDKGKIGVASQLDVWRSLWIYLGALRDAGYSVDVPSTPEELLATVLEERQPDGPPATAARIAHRYPAGQYLRDYEFGERTRACWGAPPGDFDTDGVDMFIHGAHFGHVFVCCQPSMGYGADPLSLLYNPDAAPTHAFAAFYTYLRRHIDPHLVVHFGTHGALEFMPGKQIGLEERDFSHHLIMPVPHLYLYVTSNPSEAMIAKRRSYASICNYLSAPLGEAGLYDELRALRDDLTRSAVEPNRICALRERAEALHLDRDVDFSLAETDPPAWLEQLAVALDEVADTLVALGLHVLGEGAADARPILRAAAELGRPDLGLPVLLDDPRLPALVEAVHVETSPPTGLEEWHRYLRDLATDLAYNEEVPRFLAATGGAYIEPGTGGDPIRHRDCLPTGRNTFAINPLLIPTARAVARGAEQAEALLAASRVDGRYPESIGLVMWGVDTIKTCGEAAEQVFALIGVEPTPDVSGRVTRFRVKSLEELGRPRIDVVVTTTGVFRDLFTCTMQLMDEAIRAVAELDEPDEANFIAKHARATSAELGCSIAEAATRVFSNAQGHYGSGVNQVVDAGQWESDDDLGEVYVRRQCFAYGPELGKPAEALLRTALASVEVTFQNITGAEQSIADNDHYFEYLGGLSASVQTHAGARPRVFVADNYSARPKVRDIETAMRLESRTHLLNPTWYEALLQHGFQGVTEIGHRLDNTYGWSATVDAVDDWIFSAAAETYLFDDALRERMAALNPAAVRAMAERLREAADRGLWNASDTEQQQLDDVMDELDDIVEGVS